MVIQIKTHHKRSGAESVRHTIMRGKHVEPEDAGIDHLFEREGRKMLKGDGMVVHAASAVFNRMVKTLNFRDVFIIGTNIQARTGTCQASMEGLKFAVSMNHLDKKAVGAIEAHDGCKGLGHSILLMVQKELSDTKLEIPRNGDKEGHLVNKHNVHTEGDQVIQGENVRRERGDQRGDM